MHSSCNCNYSRGGCGINKMRYRSNCVQCVNGETRKSVYIFTNHFQKQYSPQFLLFFTSATTFPHLLSYHPNGQYIIVIDFYYEIMIFYWPALMPYGGCSTRLIRSARGGWVKYWYFWWFMMNGVIIYVLLLLNYWYRWLHFEWLDGYGNHSRRVRGLRLTSYPHSAEWRAKQLGSWNVDDDNMIPQPNNILT